MQKIAEIALDRKSPLRFDYLVPEAFLTSIAIGMRVKIQLRKSLVKGTVVALKTSSECKQLLPILELLTTTSSLNPMQWKLAQWIAKYYATPIEKVIRLFIPAPIRKEVKMREKKDDSLLLEAEFFQSAPKILNSEQSACFHSIQNSIQKQQFATHLIFGVTGSGKTEIYLQAILEARKQKKGALFLVPEISLTSQTIERVRSRVSEKIAVLHHKRSQGERNDAWKKLASGEIFIAIGARSALFAPISNLGLIIVDEEHDSSYKQMDEMPCYHARNVAVMRGSLESATVLLGSATPSLESRYNAEIGKYTFHALTHRATSAPLPKIHIVDMKEAQKRNGGFTHFSDVLLNGIEERLKKKRTNSPFFE